MPEGDTIFRTAATLRHWLVGRTIAAARSNQPGWPVGELAGQVIAEVEARGKHLLLHLANGSAVHSHLGMTGSWHVYEVGSRWRKPERQAALVLQLGERCCVCFSPKTLELLTADRLRRHPHLTQMGPDLLSPQFSLSEALSRLRLQRSVPVGEAIMNQTVVSGVGNVYKSEVLFLCGLDPLAPVGELDDALLRRLLHEARRQLLRNRSGYPRQTRLSHGGGKLWVYRRAGKPCYHCGTAVLMRRQGELGRSTYWCPRCQSSSEPTSP